MLSHEISKNTFFFKGQNGILFHKIISLINCKRRYSIYFCFICLRLVVYPISAHPSSRLIEP